MSKNIVNFNFGLKIDIETIKGVWVVVEKWSGSSGKIADRAVFRGTKEECNKELARLTKFYDKVFKK